MSDALLGAIIGAGAALIGGFLVQRYIARQAARRRLQELVGSFLSIQENIGNLASENEGTEPFMAGSWRSSLRDEYARAAAVGHELAILCDPEVSEDILESLRLSVRVWASTDLSKSRQERDAAIESLRINVRVLAPRLHARSRF
ncbi:MAG: hypothetical protein ACREXY_00020 [Gammaproteobacteria bacterium]